MKDKLSDFAQSRFPGWGKICESILALESWDLWSVSGSSKGVLGGLWEVSGRSLRGKGLQEASKGPGLKK